MQNPDRPQSILIVDDETAMLDLLQDFFTTEGHRCITTTNPVFALDLIAQNAFDVMITDIRMSDMDGLTLTEKAKKLRPSMTIIIMSGFTEEFSYDSAITAGASDFLKKPFTLQELKIRLKHAKLQEELRLLALTDELTGLYNRRGFITLAAHQLKISTRINEGVFLLYADLDDLKLINDTYGHAEGDLAIKTTARILLDNFRESDIIARVGGDEFAIVPVGNKRKDTALIVERFYAELDDFNASSGKPYKLSISVGLSYYDPEKPCSIEKLLNTADQAMYRHKRGETPPFIADP